MSVAADLPEHKETCSGVVFFNGEMSERADGAVCWVLVFVVWDSKSPDELLHSSPLTS